MGIIYYVLKYFPLAFNRDKMVFAFFFERINGTILFILHFRVMFEMIKFVFVISQQFIWWFYFVLISQIWSTYWIIYS